MNNNMEAIRDRAIAAVSEMHEEGRKRGFDDETLAGMDGMIEKFMEMTLPIIDSIVSGSTDTEVLAEEIRFFWRESFRQAEADPAIKEKFRAHGAPNVKRWREVYSKSAARLAGELAAGGE